MTDSDLLVVGVDGSEGGQRALRWAMQEATRSGSSVVAVTAWEWDGIETSMIAATSPEHERQRAERTLDDQIEAVMAEAGADVPVASRVLRGRAAPILTQAAAGARMLVLGSHGHSRLHHALLGSVAEECIRTTPCPVVVVPVGTRQAAAR